jgi:S1-C subfamily serine protease
MTDSMRNEGLALSEAAADAVARAGQVTVMVNARKRLPLSGLLFAAGLVLTANHGVEREEGITVVLPDGTIAPAALAGRDRGFDLAVLRLENATGLAPAVAAAGVARVGSLVAAVGRPSAEGIQASLGMVSALGGGLRTHHGAVLERYLVTDAVPYPGFSGGPLVNLGGEILGMNTSGLVRGMSLAIPAQAAWDAARSLAEHGHIRRAYLGIRSQAVELPLQARAHLGRDQQTGLLVMGVEADGPAAEQLMVGDLLVALQGRPVLDHEDLLAALAGDVAGKPLEATVLRAGKLTQVAVTPGEKA